MTAEEIDATPAEALDEAVAVMMEPRPCDVSAQTLRGQQRNFVWVSCHTVSSARGWWQAEIGTDHGPPEADDDPVRWVPAKAPSDDPAADYEVLKAICARCTPLSAETINLWTRFGHELRLTWEGRNSGYPAHYAQYVVGDYARAALRAVAGVEGDAAGQGERGKP